MGQQKQVTHLGPWMNDPEGSSQDIMKLEAFSDPHEPELSASMQTESPYTRTA